MALALSTVPQNRLKLHCRDELGLTGIEPAGYQFSSVQLGLSSCVFGLVQFATRAFRAVWMADVLPRCCPATRIRLLKIPIPLRAGNPMLADRPGIGPGSFLRAQSTLRRLPQTGRSVRHQS